MSLLLTTQNPLRGEACSPLSALLVVIATVPDADVVVELSVAALAVVVVAEFVEGAEAYFVQNPPKSSLQRAGQAVPPLTENRSSAFKVSMLSSIY